MDREELAARIGERVDAMVAAGVADEVREAAESGASRTARAALGFDELLEGHDASPSRDEVEAIKTAHRRYARRQLTWMRRMEGVTLIDRTGLDDAAVVSEIDAAARGTMTPQRGWDTEAVERNGASSRPSRGSQA